MAKTEKKTADREDTTYRATLKVGDQQIANITIRATDDDDAKKQLEYSKPSHFDGIGEWTLSKTETVEVK